jgi:hypothetical protein
MTVSCRHDVLCRDGPLRHDTIGSMYGQPRGKLVGWVKYLPYLLAKVASYVAEKADVDVDMPSAR